MESTLSKPNQPSTRMAFLDVARCIAAILVLIEHAMNILYRDVQDSAGGYAIVGKVGVILFFLISGFIIPRSLEQGNSQLRFWIRRFFRLYPAYWLSIAAGWLVCKVTGINLFPSFDTNDWLINLTMLQGFITRKHLWGVFWTLQLELIFYLGISCVRAMDWMKHVRWLAIIVFVVFGLGEFALIYGPGSMIRIDSAFLVLLATVIGWNAESYINGRMSLRFLLLIISLQMAIFTLVWAAGYRELPEVSTRALGEFLLTWGAAYILFFVLLAMRNFRMPSALCYFGRISYSVYLLHLLTMTIAVLLLTNSPGWIKISAWLPLTLAVASAAYFFVEKPGIKLGRGFEKLFFAT